MYQIRKVSGKIVKNYINKNKNIVFVGMTVKIPNPDYKYFIKIIDFAVIYKRLLSRELDKIIKNEKKIRNEIKRMNNPKINHIERISELSTKFPPSFMDLKNDYKERLLQAKKDGYIAKTQENIIKSIQYSLKHL